MDDLQKRIDRAFSEASKKYNVDENLLRGIAQTESGGDINAKSGAGAIGLMQFMPSTAKSYNIDPHDPVQSIYGAASLMNDNLNHFGNVNKALKAYNNGYDESRWNNPETEQYDGKVLKNMENIAKIRNQTKPVDISYSPNDNKDVDDATLYGWSEKSPVANSQISASGVDTNVVPIENNKSESINTNAPKETVSDSDLYGWTEKKPEETKPNIASKENINPIGFDYNDVLKNGKTIGNDILLASGRQGLKAVSGISHLLGYATSLGNRYPNFVSDDVEQLSKDIKNKVEDNELDHKNDYGSGVSNAVGSTIGDLALMGAGGKLVGPLADLLPSSRLGRVATNILKGQGTTASKIVNGALASGVEGQLVDNNGLEDARNALLLGTAGKYIGDVAKKGSGTLSRILDTFDDSHINNSPSSATASNTANTVVDKLNPKAQQKTVGKISIFSNPESRAEAIIKAFTSKSGTPLYEAQTPGAYHTLATRSQDANLAGLESNIRDANPGAFQIFDKNNSDAYTNHIKNTIHDNEHLTNLEDERRESEQDLRNQAFANEAPVPAGHLVDRLDSLIEQNAGRPTVQAGLKHAKEAMSAVVDENGQAIPSKLWNVRKEINEGIQKSEATDKTGLRSASAQLQNELPILTDTIEEGAPGFKNYLNDYRDKSSVINSLRKLQTSGLIEPITDGSQTGERVNFSKLQNLIKSIDNNKSSKVAKATDAILPIHETELRKVYEDMLAERTSRNMAKSTGSNTYKNGMNDRKKNIIASETPGKMASVAIGALTGHGVGASEGGMAGMAGLYANNALVNKLNSARLRKSEAIDSALVNKLLRQK